jgi:hypothetical protein
MGTRRLDAVMVARGGEGVTTTPGRVSMPPRRS